MEFPLLVSIWSIFFNCVAAVGVTVRNVFFSFFFPCPTKLHERLKNASKIK